MRSKQASPDQIRALERKAQALTLRREGKTYRVIAQTMGISEAYAHQLVVGEYRRLVEEGNETAQEALKQALDKLDELMAVSMPKASSGDLKAIEATLKIIDRQSRLMGLTVTHKATAEEAVKRMSDEQLIEEARRLGIMPKEAKDGGEHQSGSDPQPSRAG